MDNQVYLHRRRKVLSMVHFQWVIIAYKQDRRYTAIVWNLGSLKKIDGVIRLDKKVVALE